MNIRFFQHQDEGLIASLITAMKPMFQMAGEMLCHQGHVGKEMYFVLKGMIEATVDDIRYKPTLVGIYLRGSYCADTALVLNSRRPLSLRAVTHCDLFALSKVSNVQVGMSARVHGMWCVGGFRRTSATHCITMKK